MKSRRYPIVMLLAVSLLLGSRCYAQVVVSSVSSWTRTLDGNDLTTPYEAGMNLKPTIETLPNFNQLDISNVANTQGWKISVSRQDINWPAAFTISVRRNTAGVPCASCPGVNAGSSPTTYIPVTIMETDLIFGTGGVNGIDLQFKVDGLSLLVDAQSYSTEIIYTLYGE